jgi:hypothetical protein
VVRIVRLHHDAPRQFAPAGPARDLRHELKDALGGAEVRHRERVVAAHHAHQRDAVNVVALGDHLRAHQQVDLARVQPRQQPFQVAAAAHRVAVHAADARAGKDFPSRSSPCCEPAPRKYRCSLPHLGQRAGTVRWNPQ